MLWTTTVTKDGDSNFYCPGIHPSSLTPKGHLILYRERVLRSYTTYSVWINSRPGTFA